MKKKIAIALLILVFFSGCIALLSKKRDGINVRAVRAERDDIASVINATGKVVSGHEITLSTQEAGLIKVMHVREGQKITHGELIAELDSQEADNRLIEARAVLAESKARRRQELNRNSGIREVYNAGGMSLVSLKDSESSLEICTEAENKAVSEVKAAEIRLARTKIISPCDGTITRKDADSGEWISPGMPLATIAGSESREIEVAIDESDAGFVKPGQMVEISSDSYPGLVWKEKVRQLDPAVQKDGTANTVKARIDCGSETPDLKFGQQVDAKIFTSVKTNTLALPFEAIVSKNGKPFIALAVADRVSFSPVKTGIENTTHIEILSGLKEGDEVIVPEGKGFKEGIRIKTITKE